MRQLCRSRREENTMELKGKVINFLGDSITEGIGTSGKDKTYVSLIEKQFELKRVNNYGIEGTRIADYVGEEIKFWGDSFSKRFPLMDDNADVVVVFGGTNDFGHGNAPIGSFADNTRETFYGALHILMRGLIEKYPKAEIVFMTPLHRRNELDPQQFTGELFKRYVDVIREMAQYYSIPVVDLYSESGIQPDIPVIKELYCPDGLHPSDAGHIKIAKCLASFLKGR